MSSELNSFRLLNRLDLSPSFTSLGLAPEMFHDGGDGDASNFNAAMSGPGDILWLFRGEDFIGYDLRQEKVTFGPAPIAGGWANGALLADFQIGVDSALWGGPGVSNLTFLFRGGNFLRLDCSADPANPAAWSVVFGPYPTGKEWLHLPSTDGRPHYGPVLEPCAKLYGLREAANRVHYNLENGEYDIAPTDTMSQFPLPASSGGRVDIAFYGAGAEAEHIRTDATAPNCSRCARSISDYRTCWSIRPRLR
jgi:hypothetical protein